MRQQTTQSVQPRQSRFKWRDRVTSLPNICRLVRLAWHSSRGWLVATIILRTARAATPIIMFWIPKLILDDLIIAIKGTRGNFHAIAFLVALQFVVAILSDIMTRLSTFSENMLAESISSYVSVTLMQHAAALSLTAIEDPIIYAKLDRARNQAAARTLLIASLLSICEDLGIYITLLVGFIVISPWLVLFLTLSIVPSFVYESCSSVWRADLTRSAAPQQRKMDYFLQIATTLEGAKELRMFGIGEYLTNSYRQIADRVYVKIKTLDAKRAAYGSLVSILNTGTYYGAYVIALLQVVRGTISLGTFTFISSSFARSRGCIARISSGLSVVSDNSLLLNDLFDVLDLRTFVQREPDGLPFPNPVKHGIEFKDVCFAYPGTNHYVVKHLNFSIHPGESIAFVGENGSGKTTIIKLLSGLYVPSEGQILLDGIDLQRYDMKLFRQHVSTVFQDFGCYELSVRENVGIGNIAAADDDCILRQALEASDIYGSVATMPGGYEQVLGRRFEDGVDLSGGQWQKLALARAYVRTAELVILDEPSASLDARAEAEVFEKFQDLIAGRMAVLISHRLVVSRLVDKIFVIACGVIEEEGTHHELMASNRRYASLYELQAAGYR